MKNTAPSTRRLILATGIATLLGLSSSGVAQSVFWDPGTDGDGLLGGGGVWNLSNPFWDPAGTDAAVDNGVWANNNTAIAVFGGAPGVVTLNNAGATMTANGLTFNTSGYLLSSNVAGDSLTLAGTAPTITVATAGHLARINSILAGTSGLTVAGAGNLILGGANTFTGQTVISPGSTLTLAGLSVGPVAGGGVGNETVVQSGGTLNLGGQAYGNQAPASTTAEIFRIAGTGVGGVGALINSASSQINAISKIILTDDATISAGSGISTSFAAGGGILSSAGGRFDLRNNAAPTAGQAHLDLAGKTLTKIGGHQFAVVNGDISSGNIVVNEGHLYFEANTLAGSGVNVTVNPNGKFGWWSIANGANITAPVTVNGGTVGDITSTGASQTVNSPITITGSLNPNFVANANTTTLAGVISEDGGSTVTEVSKRGGATLAFSNQANGFDAPVAVYAGTLQANYTALFSGGTPAAPTALAGAPLGIAATAIVAGGTLNIRVDGSNNSTSEVFSIGKTITVDRAPSGINLDRLTATGGTEKNLSTSVTFAKASASNGYSIGQNQLSMTQGNSFRLMLAGATMNDDTVLNNGDFTFTGDTTSPNRNSLIHIGGSSWGFIGGTHEAGATFNIGGSQMRIGQMYGTTVTSDTATAGTGTIYNGPNNSVTFRSATNIASGQAIDLFSNRLGIASANFQNFTAIPANLRASGSGALGVAGATAFGPIDLSRLGDGSFRVVVGLGGSGNGTVTGAIKAGAGNVVRVGGTGNVLTLSGTDIVSGSAALEVGSDLINGTIRTTQANSLSGTVLLSGANNYTGGTIVNRGATLEFRSTLGSGGIFIGGTASASSAGNAGPHGTFIGAGTATIVGGSTIRFINDAITVTGTPTPDRWGDSEPLNLVASTVEMRSRSIPTVASTTTEDVGPMTVAGGAFVNLQRPQAFAGHVNELRVDSLTRINQGTLELQRSTGTNAGYSDGNRLTIDSGAPAVVNGMVAPWIIAQNNGPTDFVTYTPTGFLPITYDVTQTTATYTAGAWNFNGTTGGKVQITTADPTLADDPTLYALRSERTILTSGANDTITLRSGGLNLRNIIDNSTLIINPLLVANDGANNIELLVNTAGGGTGRNYQLTGAITANGFTKSGTGNLIVGTANPNLTGTVAVNAGTLELRAATVTPGNLAGNGTIRLQGGQLNVRGAAGSYPLPNAVTVAQNIPIAVIDSNRTDATSTGNVTFAGPLVMEGSPNAQGQTLTVQGAQYGVIFNGTGNAFTGNVTFNNGINFTLNDNPDIAGTNPIITKAGGGLLEIGANGGASTVSTGTQVHLNDGTLQLRSITTVGTAATTSLVLNRGTLNLRREGVSVFGSPTITTGAGYPVLFNGTATISVARIGGSANDALHTLGKLTMANDNATLTVNNDTGNGSYSLGFQGVDLGGRGFINSGVAAGNQDAALRFLSGFDVSGGALVKGGTGHLHLLNANSTYDGGTYANQGVLRVRAAGALGTGPVYLNPGATIDFNANDNLGTTQPLIVRGNSAYLPMISVNNTTTNHPTANVDASAAANGIVGLSNGSAGVYNSPIDLGALYGGGWSLGGVSAGAYDPRYTASTLGAGSGNLYRLGGGGTSMQIGHDAAGTAVTNLLTGSNNVRIGFDSGNILPANTTNFQYAIAGNNNYSGGSTVIHRGQTARIFAAPDLTNNLTAFSNSAVDVFGVLSLSGSSSLVNSANSGNINAITLHPGSALFLDNQNGGVGGAAAAVSGNIADRLHDSTAITLNGSLLNLIGRDNVAVSETVGPVTYGPGARLRTERRGTGTATLTLASLTPSGAGSTLMIQTAGAGTLGAGGTNFDRIIVATDAPTPVNGMVSPSIVNTTDATFVTYGANGFANVTYDNTVNAAALPIGLAATAKVDITTTDPALADSPTIHALRTSRTINVGGAFNTVTIRSGGLISNNVTDNSTITINPNLVFNDGTQNVEAFIHTNSGTGRNHTLNGNITANGVTKFGPGNLLINVPQSGNTGTWTVNSGTLVINDPQGLGNRPVTLNASLSTTGQTQQNLGQTTLQFARDMGTAEQVTFSGGPITVNNEATIQVGPGVDNRYTQVPSIVADSTGAGSSVGLTLQIPNARTRGIVPTLTLNDDTTLRVWDGGADLGRVSAVAVNSLAGSGVDLVKLGNRTLELPGNNAATFTGGSITVSQGTLRVRDNGALGSATTATTIERNAALEIATSAFAPAGTLTQQAGSVERWNVEDARSTSYNLPAGVNLQLNTNLLAARTIGLNGGSLEGFLYTDHVAPADQRLVGSAVTLNLLADSFVGQNILQGFGYDTGRAPSVGGPFTDAITGAQLRIEGQITGAGRTLTKTGLDTVTLASTGNTYGDTIVEMGTLRTATADALGAGTLTTKLGGVFDLYGTNQTVAALGTTTGGPAVSGTSLGESGRITNSGVTDNILTVTGATNTTYNGIIDRNTGLTRAGSGELTLTAVNTYVGPTTITSGTLNISGSIAGSATAVNGGTLKGTGTVGALTLNSGGTLAPGASPGIMNASSTTFAGGTFALEINGTAVGTEYDQLNVTGGVSLTSNTPITIALGFDPADDGSQSFIIIANDGSDAINLAGGLFAFGGTPLGEGASFDTGAQLFSISYAGGTGNDVVLTAIPEPSTAAALVGSLGVLLGLRRRRRA